MPDDLANRVIASTTPKFFKGFVDGMAKKAVEFYWAKENDLFTYNQGGRELQWRVRLGRGSPMGYLGGFESKTFAARNDHQVATAEWRGIADGICITQQEQWQCKTPEQIFPLVRTLMEDMEDDLTDEFGTSFYSDGTRLSSKTFHGLGYSIVTTGTVYGISTTTYTNWAAQSVDGTGFNAAPLDKLVKLILTCATGQRGGRTRNKVDILLCPQDKYEVVWSHEVAKGRYTQNVKMAQAGFDNIEINGTPLAWSEYCTDATIFALNSNLFEIVCGTPELFMTETERTVGFPKLLLGTGVSHFNMLNKNPRGSGKLTSVDS